MTDFLERIQKLSPKQLAVLALRLNNELEQTKAARSAPIAIVGMGCRFPGGIDSPDAYWHFLLEGHEAIREVPADRWKADDWFDTNPDTDGKMSVKLGGFLDDVAGFDAASFGITPREASTMDPQQRLLLEVAWETLEHAGIAPDSLSGTDTGVFVGLCNSDHYHRVLERGAEQIDVYLASGNASSVAAGRISYTLGLNGPAMTVDTACSSSLVALHQAVQSLRNEECTLALAGGVNVICEPETMVALSKAGMLAPDGRCKAFDASADGFSRGEGCGLIALKKLSDAERDNDRIYAVIRGSAMNQDGRSAGLTVPSRTAQENLIRKAVEDAGVTPHDISYIEAHGTGTRLGDPIEIRAISAALTKGRDKPLIVGSAKTNFGHLESAAGIAGVMKTALSLHHGKIPPHLHFTNGNPEIDWDRAGVRIATKAQDWPAGAARRLAGVSSFGFSGTNAHLVLEDSPHNKETRSADTPSVCLPVSARSEAALKAQAKRLSHALGRSDASLSAIASTLATGRAHLPDRLAVHASTPSEAQAALNAFCSGQQDNRLRSGHVEPGQSSGVVFLCTGQGAQYPGMARQLYERFDVFRDVIDRCSAALGIQENGRTLIEVMNDAESSGALLHKTEWTQPALFAVECGLAALWRSWGVEPSAVIGHSAGEFAAATIAGVFDLEDGLKLVAARGKLLAGLPAGGAMAAIFLSEAEASDLIAPFREEVSIAAINARDSVVISGSSHGIDSILKKLSEAGIQGHKLHISFAAHSPQVDSVLSEMEQIAGSIKAQPATIPVAWNLTGGAPLPAGAPDAKYWRQHLREPVRFSEGMTKLQKDGHRVFLEIGPHPVLAALAARDVSDDKDAPVFLGSLRRGHDDMSEISSALGTLFVEGVSVDWTKLNSGKRPQPVPLPTYPFQRTRYWIEPSEKRNSDANRQKASANLLGKPVDKEAMTYNLDLSTHTHPWLADHMVHGSALVAGPVYLSMAVGAAEHTTGETGWSIKDFHIHAPLYAQTDTVTVETRLNRLPNGAVSFTISSRTQDNENQWIQHASGHLVSDAPDLPASGEDIASRASELGQENLAAAHLEKLASLGIKLSGSFRTLDQLHRHDGELIAHLGLPENAAQMDAPLAHPGLLDGVLQAAGATLAAPDEASGTPLFFLTGIGRLILTDPLPNRIWCHAVQTPASTADVKCVDVDIHDEAGQTCGRLENIQLTRANSQWAESAPTYKIAWHETPARSSAARELKSPESVAEDLERSFADISRQQNLGAYSSALPILDDISVGYISDALRKLGFDQTLGRSFDISEEAKRLLIVDGQKQLFDRLLKILSEKGILSKESNQFKVQSALPKADMAELSENIRKTQTAHAELSILRRCGESLAEVLTGNADALDLLFPGGSLAEARELYIEAPFARTYNGTITALLKQVIQDLPEGRPVRVLEIGGGTGGSTGAVLKALSSHPVEYMFTDVSPHFLESASRRFGQDESFQTGLLDIETPPASQGYEGKEYDLVIAANVLHATQDLSQAIDHASQLLAPGGVLTLLEGVAPEPWVDLTFGMTPGWWRFADTNLRTDYPLISKASWHKLLKDAKLTDIASVGGDHMLDRAASQQMLIAARKPLATRRIAVVGGEADFTARLSRAFEVFGAELLTVSDLTEVPEEVQDILYLDGLELSAAETLPADMNAKAFMTPLAHLQDLMASEKALRLWIVTCGAFACGESPVSAGAQWQAPLLGLGRVAALECPSAWGGVIDLDADDEVSAQAQCVAESLFNADIEDQTAWRQGKRYAPRLVESVVPSRSITFDKDGTYLVTGGFGGLGALIGRWLAENGAGRVALLGRHPDPDGPAMAAIREAGADARALKADVSDPDALKAALDTLQETGPALRGAFHAAAHLEAAPLEDLTAEKVQAMFLPKVVGTLALEQSLEQHGADFLALFSSTTAVLGAPGFAHYAAANAFLDATAERHPSGLQVFSIGWGTWDTMRLASDDTQKIYTAQGLIPMRAEAALASLGDLMCDARTGHTLVAEIDWQLLRDLHETRRARPMLSGLKTSGQAHTTRAKQTAIVTETSETDLKQQLANAPEAARLDILARFVSEQAAQVMGESSGDHIPPDRGLFEMGMDSLMSVELRRKLEVGTGLKLPSTLTFNYPNVNALAGFLETRFAPQEAAPPKHSPAPSETNSGQAEDDDDMSEEDIMARLRAKLDTLE